MLNALDLEDEFSDIEVILEPPTDGRITEEDSCDDENVSGFTSNLSGKQLEATCASYRVGRSRYNSETSTSSSDDSLSGTEHPVSRLLPENLNHNTKWVKDVDLQPRGSSYFEVAEKKFPELEGMTALQYFELFFDEEVITFITEMTNKYAKEVRFH